MEQGMLEAITDTVAVVLEAPERLSLRRLALTDLAAEDVAVEIEWSGISTGTERLLYTGRMPPFPGLGYPLVPGYESVGRIVEAGPRVANRIGETVFVPGATCYREARGLFGGAARRVILPASRAVPVPENLAERGVLIALAATAQHAMAGGQGVGPDLIVGHGVLGRLLARATLAAGFPAPTVWETNAIRRTGAEGYAVLHPDDDARRDYRAIYDVSGAPDLLDALIGRLAKGGEIVLAGFYESALSFRFPPAFMKEARLRVAAEWRPEDLAATQAAIAEGRLNLDGLITHRRAAEAVGEAYRTAFEDPQCLKMIVDWGGVA
jgi:3-hydroxyethyl bacteriochlorophyllide a dehydrogenase